MKSMGGISRPPETHRPRLPLGKATNGFWGHGQSEPLSLASKPWLKKKMNSLKWVALVSGNMDFKTCGLPLLFNFEPHPIGMRLKRRKQAAGRELQWKIGNLQKPRSESGTLNFQRDCLTAVYLLPASEMIGKIKAKSPATQPS